jgi:hypothetical protein
MALTGDLLPHNFGTLNLVILREAHYPHLVISREAKPRAGFPDWGSWQRNALTDEVNLIIPNTLPTLSS